MADPLELEPEAFLEAVGHLEPAAKGAWLVCLLKLKASKRYGVRTMPLSDWARAFGCADDEALALFERLRTVKDARVTILSRKCHVNVTVKSQRMVAMRKSREGARLRQERRRQKERVTEMSRGGGNNNNNKDSVKGATAVVVNNDARADGGNAVAVVAGHVRGQIENHSTVVDRARLGCSAAGLDMAATNHLIRTKGEAAVVAGLIYAVHHHEQIKDTFAGYARRAIERGWGVKT